MDEKSLPQYAKIEQPFGIDPPIVHCPICGTAVFDNEEGCATPCPHFAFLYVGEVGEFEYTSVAFTKKTESLEAENLDFETFSDFLAKAGYDNKLLAIEITYGGMACGPVWYTDVFGFDYGSLADSE